MRIDSNNITFHKRLAWLLIVVGIGFSLTFGIIPIVQTLSLEEAFEKQVKSHFKCNDQVRCIPADAVFWFQFKDQKPVELKVLLNFSANEVFAVDNPINYTIDAKINQTNGMDLLYYVIVSPKENLNYSNYKSAHSPKGRPKQQQDGKNEW